MFLTRHEWFTPPSAVWRGDAPPAAAERDYANHIIEWARVIKEPTEITDIALYSYHG